MQHLQGIKAGVIAVNLDANTPALVRRADLSIIDDTKRVAEALLAKSGAGACRPIATPRPAATKPRIVVLVSVGEHRQRDWRAQAAMMRLRWHWRGCLRAVTWM